MNSKAKFVCTMGLAMMSALPTTQAQTVGANPEFNDKGELQRPVNFREWVFVTSGLGMNYGPSQSKPGEAPQFTNVYVNPPAWRAYMSTGVWPDGTFFILDVRPSLEHASAQVGGRTQGSTAAVEAAVKDSARYPDGGWAYFSFDGESGLLPAAKALPRTASCYSCHQQHGAVEWTFTQFYPDQFAVAKQRGTVRRDYDPARKVE